MIRREFLGWERPFAGEVVAWLLARRDELPGMTVLVPTSQSGRLLRAALVDAAGALLSPRILTPGALLATDTPGIAAAWQEELAWMETIRAVEDWSAFAEVFPDAPLTDRSGAEMLARELAALRHRLQQNGLTLARVARLLGGTPEAARWQQLAGLERLVEGRLSRQGMESRSRVLAESFRLPVDPAARMVLAGVADPAPLLRRLLAAHPGGVVALIAAPETEAGTFSLEGIPREESWCHRPLVSPAEAGGAIRLCADARVQADAALARVLETGADNTQVALGAPDPEVAEELSRVFTSAGWAAFVPGEQRMPWGLRRWLKTWREFLDSPCPAVMADLLALPETMALLGTGTHHLARQLAILRNDWLPPTVEDLRRRFATETWRSGEHRERAAPVDEAAGKLLRARAAFLSAPFSVGLPELLGRQASGRMAEDNAYQAAFDFAHEAGPVADEGDHDSSFWLGMLLHHLPDAASLPPENRAIDISGWLELPLHPAPHLVLCGMNEGHVPPRDTGDPWLGDGAAALLGLPTRDQRWARDAFLYHSLISSRMAEGSATVFCGRSNSAGDILQPSRLLLAAPPEELPGRVRLLFRNVAAPEDSLPWAIGTPWLPPAAALPETMNVTAFRSYLQCPFRFYLKHMLRLQGMEPDRVEWNQRDFGNIAHAILETWGRDPLANDFNKTEAIEDFLLAALDREVERAFGGRPTLAIRIQKEALAQRLGWFARLQAVQRAEGWKVVGVEHAFELPLEGFTVKGTIDRIDRHEGSGEYRVIDYKTGKLRDRTVEQAHRKELRGEPAEHLAREFALISRGGKEFRWTDLQLPLYAAAWQVANTALPVPCYVTLAETEPDTRFAPWAEFSQEDADDARTCAAWILRQIRAGAFWPPADGVPYDDFAFLAAGRGLAEACQPVCSFTRPSTS